jgi:hypothetical protein
VRLLRALGIPCSQCSPKVVPPCVRRSPLDHIGASCYGRRDTSIATWEEKSRRLDSGFAIPSDVISLLRGDRTDARRARSIRGDSGDPGDGAAIPSKKLFVRESRSTRLSRAQLSPGPCHAPQAALASNVLALRRGAPRRMQSVRTRCDVPAKAALVCRCFSRQRAPRRTRSVRTRRAMSAGPLAQDGLPAPPAARRRRRQAQSVC